MVEVHWLDFKSVSILNSKSLEVYMIDMNFDGMRLPIYSGKLQNGSNEGCIESQIV